MLSFQFPLQIQGIHTSSLRTTHLMTLHILTDKLDLILLANQFVAGDTHRLTVFGTFN